jgi:hypothetical protein
MPANVISVKASQTQRNGKYQYLDVDSSAECEPEPDVMTEPADVRSAAVVRDQAIPFTKIVRPGVADDPGRLDDTLGGPFLKRQFTKLPPKKTFITQLPPKKFFITRIPPELISNEHLTIALIIIFS